VARRWCERGPCDAEIAAFDDDPDALRLTATVSLVVRATRPKALDRFAGGFRAGGDGPTRRASRHWPTRRACQEGLDEIESGPAGQLGYLAGIPGVAS
jgi:hypothetical protein